MIGTSIAIEGYDQEREMCGSRHYRYEIREREREDPDLRASDADRERVAQLLRDSAGDGRLDMDELAERLDAVYASRTFGELQTLTRDLPVVAHRGPRTPARHFPTRLVWISVVLVVIWAATGAGYFWPLWPMLWFCFAAMRYRAHGRAFARATRA
jgi:DUF1707 SHOCT-like domain